MNIKEVIQEFFFVGADSALHYFYLGGNGAWAHDGSSFGKVHGDISAVFESQRNHSGVFYKGENDYVNYSYLGGNGAWAHDRSSFNNGGKCQGAISAVFEPQRKHSAVFFHGGDDYVQYFYLGGNGAWAHNGSSFKKEKVVGDISAVFNKAHNHSAVMYMGENGNQVLYSVPSGSWQCDNNSFDAHKCSGRIGMAYAEQRKQIESYCEGSGCGSYYYSNGSKFCCDDSTFKH